MGDPDRATRRHALVEAVVKERLVAVDLVGSAADQNVVEELIAGDPVGPGVEGRVINRFGGDGTLAGVGFADRGIVRALHRLRIGQHAAPRIAQDAAALQPHANRVFQRQRPVFDRVAVAQRMGPGRFHRPPVHRIARVGVRQIEGLGRHVLDPGVETGLRLLVRPAAARRQNREDQQPDDGRPGRGTSASPRGAQTPTADESQNRGRIVVGYCRSHHNPGIESSGKEVTIVKVIGLSQPLFPERSFKPSEPPEPEFLSQTTAWQASAQIPALMAWPPPQHGPVLGERVGTDPSCGSRQTSRQRGPKLGAAGKIRKLCGRQRVGRSRDAALPARCRGISRGGIAPISRSPRSLPNQRC